MIHTEQLTRTFRVGKETVEAVRGRRPRRRARASSWPSSGRTAPASRRP